MLQKMLAALGMPKIITDRPGWDAPPTSSSSDEDKFPIDGIYVTGGLKDCRCGYLGVWYDPLD